MPVQTLVPKTAVKRFDVRIVGRPDRSTEHQGDLVLIRPQARKPTGKLAAVITVHPFRNPSLAPDLFQGLYDLDRTHPERGGCRQTLARIYIDHRQYPQPGAPCSRSATKSIAQDSFRLVARTGGL